LSQDLSGRDRALTAAAVPSHLDVFVVHFSGDLILFNSLKPGSFLDLD
jgi:hypothetical protein